MNKKPRRGPRGRHAVRAKVKAWLHGEKRKSNYNDLHPYPRPADRPKKYK